MEEGDQGGADVVLMVPWWRVWVRRGCCGHDEGVVEEDGQGGAVMVIMYCAVTQLQLEECEMEGLPWS